MSIQQFHYPHPLLLDSGEALDGFTLAYQTFGTLNEDHSNVVWIVHALTANSDPTEWWPGVVGEGLAIDPKIHFIICANCLGSHYGSTSPLSVEPKTGKPYFHRFPLLTNRDIVHAFRLLKDHLGISTIGTLVGASLGGQQSLEWAIAEPEAIQHLILIGTNAFHSPWGIAFNESQRMAIRADQTWKEDRPDAGLEGMKVARSMALLSYRNAYSYNLTQVDLSEKLEGYRATTYQQYQGDKLAARFNAFSYYTLSKAMDNHHAGRGRGGLEAALALVKAQTLVIGIDTDLLFPLEEQKFLSVHISYAKLEVLQTDLGHDGFLTEPEKMGKLMEPFIRD